MGFGSDATNVSARHWSALETCVEPHWDLWKMKPVAEPNRVPPLRGAPSPMWYGCACSPGSAAAIPVL